MWYGGEWSLPLSYSHFDDLMYYSATPHTHTSVQALKHTGGTRMRAHRYILGPGLLDKRACMEKAIEKKTVKKKKSKIKSIKM